MPWQKRGYRRRLALRRHTAAIAVIVMSVAALAGCAIVVL